jgi:hypothetical protein
MTTLPKYYEGDIVINPDQMVSDPIMGEVSLKDFLRESLDNLIFIFANNYYGIDANQIIPLMVDKRKSGNSAIYYECLESDSLRPENIVKDKPLFYLNKIGVHSGFVPKDEMTAVIKSSSSIFVVEKVVPEKRFASVVSKNYFDTQDAASASHCQTGQEGFMYRIIRVVYKEFLEEKPETDNDNMKISGGKITKRRRSRSRSRSRSRRRIKSHHKKRKNNRRKSRKVRIRG